MKIKLLLLIFIILFVINSAVASESLTPIPRYFIYSVDDLKGIEYKSGQDVDFVLMGDIEIEEEIWKPIGSSKRPFSGAFFGNNHTITFVKDTELLQFVGSENEGCGLFGNVYSGRIYDLNLVLQGNLTSNENNTGTIIGIMNGNSSIPEFTSSVLVNCTVSTNEQSVSGLNNVGGLVGYIINGSIENSSSNCSVLSKKSNTGGLVGSIFNGTITNSSAFGSVNSVEKAGGLIGTIRNGSISDSSACGSVEANKIAGGFIGYVSDDTIILNSSASGSVKPAGKFGNFIGEWAEDHKPDVINCLYQEQEVNLEPIPEKTTFFSHFFLIIGVGLILIVISIYLIKYNEVIYKNRRN